MNDDTEQVDETDDEYANETDEERWWRENDSAIPEPGDELYDHPELGPPADPAVLALMPGITACFRAIWEAEEQGRHRRAARERRGEE